jgi:hypothetical protein
MNPLSTTKPNSHPLEELHAKKFRTMLATVWSKEQGRARHPYLEDPTTIDE